MPSEADQPGTDQPTAETERLSDEQVSSLGEGAMHDISSLDEQLAALADDLIAGDMEDGDGEVVQSEDPSPKRDEASSEIATEPESEQDAAEEPAIGKQDPEAPEESAGGEAQTELEPDKSAEAEDIADPEAGAESEAEAQSDGMLESEPEPGNEVDSEADSVPAETADEGNANVDDQALEPADEADDKTEPSSPLEDSGVQSEQTESEPASGTSEPADSGDAAAKTSVRVRVLGHVRRAAGKIEPLAKRVAALASLPLNKQSPAVRRAVGFVALWTAGLAVLMVYLVMTRTAETPRVSAEASGLSGGSAQSPGDTSTADPSVEDLILQELIAEGVIAGD